MKKKAIGRILIFSIVLAIALSFTGCEAFLEFLAEEMLLTDVNGYVLDARAEAGATEWWVADATVTAHAESGTGFSATAAASAIVDSDGSYRLLNLPAGKYKITGEAAGYTFVPRYVDLSGDEMDLPPLIAYQSTSEAVVILVSWENTSIDVGGYLSYDDYDDELDDRFLIGPNEGTSYAEGSTNYINLDRSVSETDAPSVPRVESITVYDFPFAGAPTDDIAVDPEMLPSHQLRYYVRIDNPSDTLSLTGWDGNEGAAFAQVDIMYNNEHLGVWELPYNTAETVLHVATIERLSDTEYDYRFWIYSAGNANYGLRGLGENLVVPVDNIR